MSKLQSMRDFSGGVVNQELQNRDDGRGVILSANNVVSSINGELRKRTGIRLLSIIPYKSKLIPFRMPDGNDILLVFSQKGEGSDANIGKIIGFVYADSTLARFYNTVSSDVPEMPAPSSWNDFTNGNWEISTNMPRLARSDWHYMYNVFNSPVSS